MRLVECSLAEHGGAILQIMNEAIVNSTALYDYQPRDPSSMVPWFETKRAKGFPVWGAIDDAGNLVGFASYGTFRAWPAYKYSVEHSVYVAPGQQGKGIGKLLMERLIRNASEQQLHSLIGGIDARDACGLAQGLRSYSGQLLARLQAQPFDGKVIYVCGQ